MQLRFEKEPSTMETWESFTDLDSKEIRITKVPNGWIYTNIILRLETFIPA